MKAKHYFWRFANVYGFVWGRTWLAPLHRLHLNLALHALGYDNARHTGEEWFIKKVLAKESPTVCIDIGANVGAYSEILATHTKATIYAIEPAKASFTALQKTAGHYPSIKPINAAIADTNGTGTLYSRQELSEKASLSNDANEDSLLKETVELKTLDSVVAELGLQRLDFIKIDTEGHELEVFKGMQNTVSALQPTYIQFEFNHVHLYRSVTLYQLAQLLPEYELYRLLPRGWLKIHPAKMEANIFMFCNIVAKRKV